jgi:hypothetical protein
MKRESSAPEIITSEHIGSPVLVRLPGCAGPSEATVEEISPGGAYARVGRRWIEADGQNVLAVLGGPRKRREARL